MIYASTGVGSNAHFGTELLKGAEPVAKTPEELGRHVTSEMARWAKIAKIAGIKGE